ncbi:MAG: DUF2064 domain-containing protein, partial [Candidatus Omnitrophica bacterium]|nr:DUF2064 domain-containing protein [Candidatus Omnitrophota bacterium]
DTNDAVVGPASDGGFYLIGFSRPAESVFMQVDWSGERVFEQTLENLDRLEMKYDTLPEHYDIDRFRDLLRLRAELQATPALDTLGKQLLETVAMTVQSSQDAFVGSLPELS